LFSIRQRNANDLTVTDSQWFNYIVCLAGIFILSMGEGSLIFQIVPYLERQKANAFEIGITNTILSTALALTCLLIGLLYKNRRAKLYMIAGVLCMQTGAIILMFQPTGWLVKLAAGVNGFGTGIPLVLLHSTLIANRPDKISLGLTVAFYTSGIAAGNAVGVTISGLIVDSFGFAFGYLFCLICFVLLFILIFLIRFSRHDQKKPDIPPSTEKNTKSQNPSSTHRWLWKTSLIAGFSMASVMIVSEVIFPIFALKAGMSISFLGSLHGIKMIVAAIIRPLTGFILAVISSSALTMISLLLLAFSVILIPFVGLSIGLIIISILIGLSFGICRVTSATLSVDNAPTNDVNSRRIGLYSFSISLGQIITPVIGGWTADNISLKSTIVGLPIFFIVLFTVGFVILWRKNHQ
jgi:MFS family permease